MSVCQSWRLIERVASVGLVLSRQGQNSLEQNGIIQRQRNQTPEGILITVVNNKQLANLVII